MNVAHLTKRQRAQLVMRALGTRDQDNEVLLRKVKERVDRCNIVGRRSVMTDRLASP